MQTEKQKIGELGENIACKFLMKHGHEILDRNYRKKWGEIDVV
ncbi:YraN family protein, partial [Patescibacteria group bacterium]|nr:YraN family protein [Patescibacteria group bacterium]